MAGVGMACIFAGVEAALIITLTVRFGPILANPSGSWKQVRQALTLSVVAHLQQRKRGADPGHRHSSRRSPGRRPVATVPRDLEAARPRDRLQLGLPLDGLVRRLLLAHGVGCVAMSFSHSLTVETDIVVIISGPKYLRRDGRCSIHHMVSSLTRRDLTS